MAFITQPVTTTQMRRDPKSILKRLKKEKVIPIFVNSKVSAAFISTEELESLHAEIKLLKREKFVDEIKASLGDYEKNGGIGPFKTVDALMNSLNKKPKGEL